MTKRKRAVPDHYPAVPAEGPEESPETELTVEPDGMSDYGKRLFPSLQTMREATLAVFRDLQAKTKGPGQAPHYLAWAEAVPTEFYKLAARLIPIQIESEVKAVGVLIVEGLND